MKTRTADVSVPFSRARAEMAVTRELTDVPSVSAIGSRADIHAATWARSTAPVLWPDFSEDDGEGCYPKLPAVALR